jgi:hypothetical protein
LNLCVSAPACNCRVLSPLKRKPLGQQGQADPSRPSTAASLLSLNNHQQRWSGLGAQPGAQQQSRPGTGGSSSSMWRQRGSDRAGGSANSAAGGVMVGAAAAGAGVPGLGVGSAINRTLLLELVQQDDVSGGARLSCELPRRFSHTQWVRHGACNAIHSNQCVLHLPVSLRHCCCACAHMRSNAPAVLMRKPDSQRLLLTLLLLPGYLAPAATQTHSNSNAPHART